MSGTVLQYFEDYHHYIVITIAWLKLSGIQKIVKNNKILLGITELGGYPNFQHLYQAAGFDFESVTSMRKAVRSLKQRKPDVIVAEFNFQSDFRDRTSSLETLMAAVQQTVQQMEDIKVIVFYEKEYEHQFDKLRARFKFHAELAYPINEQELKQVLAKI